jgi:hypothetical protein
MPGPTCQSQAPLKRRLVAILTRMRLLLGHAPMARAPLQSSATYTAPCALSLCVWLAVEKLPLTSTHPYAISLFPLPCRWLPSSAVRTSPVLALYAPPSASSSPPRAPPHPEVPHPSAELTTTTSPHQWASLHPKPQIGSPLLSGIFPVSFFSGPGCQSAGFYRWAASAKGGKRLPCFSLGPKGSMGRARKAMAKWAWPIPTVPFHVFHSKLIQNSFKFSLNL